MGRSKLMNRFWNVVLRPIIEEIEPKYIVEVGSENGQNTKNILEYCVENNSRMTAIDPFPQFEIDEFKSAYKEKFEIYKELSLSRLPLLEDYDVILLDGDHNWYTVYNELKIIEKGFENKKFPLVFLHDVGWPYARRDLYYNPENIPDFFRQSYKKLGMAPGETNLKEEGGLNVGYKNAIYQNNPKNGVLTAIEDFINESDLELSFMSVNAFFGLGILFPKNDKLEKIIENIIQNSNLLSVMEDERIKLTIFNSESKSENISLKQSLKKNTTRLNVFKKNLTQKEIQINLKKIQILKAENRINSLNEEVKEIKQKNSELKSENNELKSENDELKSVNDELISNKYEYEYKINKNRPLKQRLISRFHNIYILTRRNNNGIKNSLLNIKSYNTIKKNNLLDIGYYLKNNSDIRLLGQDPIIHYMYHGYKEGRNPNPGFDGNFYSKKYSDIDKLNPLVHYSLYGKAEGRKPKRDHALNKIKSHDVIKAHVDQYKFSGFDPDYQGINTLFFSHNLKMQGAQSSLFDIVIGLKNKGIVNPIIFSPFDGPMKETYEKNDIEVVIGDSLHLHGSLEAFNKSLSTNIKNLEKYKIQYIHSNTLRTFYGIEIARKMNIPCSWNPRESEPADTYFDYLSIPVKEVALECFDYPNKVIFVSNYSKDNWNHLNNNNFTTIHNALNTERIIIDSANWTREESRISLGIKNNELVIIAIGTISERKGQKDILLAVDKLPLDILNNVKIFLVGDYPSEYSEELHGLYSKLPSKLKESVFLIPETNKENEFCKVIDYYTAADILIFSSRIESYPRVILEALYYNLAIITTPVFGVKEQVVDGFSALFYEPGKIEELTNQMLKLITDKDLRNVLRKNSQKQLEKLSTHEEMLDEYGQIITDAVK